MPTLYDQRTLTETVRTIQPPNTFLQDFLFPANIRRQSFTETIELSAKRAGREMVPFIKVNGEAQLYKGVGRSFSQVKPPNIRLKQQHVPHESFERKAGQGIFVTSPGQLEAAQEQKVVDDLDFMMNGIVNRQEWMVANLLRNQITYSVSDNESFTIDLPRSAGNTIDLAPNYWDTAPGTADIYGAVDIADSLVSEAEGLNITDAICGSEAAAALVGALKAQELFDQRRFLTGNLDLETLEANNGVKFLGNFHGINWWRYNRKITLPDAEGGGTFDFIRPKYVEFVNRDAVSTERKWWWGPVADYGEDGARSIHPVSMFSKSFVTQDPSQRFLLVHTRPLPWMQRPDTFVSMKVVSG